MKYDLLHINFVPNCGDLDCAFIWSRTPQGHDFWEHQYENGLTPEGYKYWNEMIKQSKEEGLA